MEYLKSLVAFRPRVTKSIAPNDRVACAINAFSPGENRGGNSRSYPALARCVRIKINSRILKCRPNRRVGIQRWNTLSIVVCGANRHDMMKLADVLEGKIRKAPDHWKGKENLCADAGYVGKEHRRTIVNHGYVPHVRPRGEEIEAKDKNPEYKPRRWIVEVSHSGFNRFKKIKERFEKKAGNFLALHHLAACIIALRKIKCPDEL